ncbi:helix-turn-helix domain-containing protein [Paraburkholderia caribensis]|uniref:helix-turn-helix domain-containing protein n=1 Tax=Paraburkholderia caribensis TaxID=75105 RepID=UPI003AAE4162
MNWAWEQRLPPATKLLLMALADAADDEGYCYPGVKTIAAKCSVSERTVQRTLKQFESGDLLVVTPRFTREGRQTSNGYRLCLIPYPDKSSPPAANSRRGAAKRVTFPLTQPCRGDHDTSTPPHEPPLEPSIESPLQLSGAAQLFFPATLLQAECASVSRLIAGIEPSEAQQLLDELTYALESGAMIKTSPVQWFRGVVKRYHEGRFTPTGAVRVQARRELQTQETTTRCEAIASNASTSEHYRLQIREATSRWRKSGRPGNSASGREVSTRTEDKEDC